MPEEPSTCPEGGVLGGHRERDGVQRGRACQEPRGSVPRDRAHRDLTKTPGEAPETTYAERARNAQGACHEPTGGDATGTRKERPTSPRARSMGSWRDPPSGLSARPLWAPGMPPAKMDWDLGGTWAEVVLASPPLLAQPCLFARDPRGRGGIAVARCYERQLRWRPIAGSRPVMFAFAIVERSRMSLRGPLANLARRGRPKKAKGSGRPAGG